MRSILGILLLVGLAATPPASSATLGLVPDDVDPDPGAEVAIEVVIGDLEVSCFSFSIEYDPSVLTYLGADEGPLFSAAPEMTFFSDDIDPFGRPQPNACLLGAGSVVAGPGTIAVLHFAVATGDVTAVWARDAVLRDVDRIELPGIPDASAELGGTATSAPGAAIAPGLSAHPNPSSSRLSLVLAGRAPNRIGTLEIFDTAGRLVRELDWPAGSLTRGWDGRDGSGHSVANGVYHARLLAADRVVSTRIVRVR